MIAEVLANLRDQLAVVGAGLVEPEHRGSTGRASARHGEANPVTNRQILHLAHPPHVARRHRVLEQHPSIGIDHAHRSWGGDLEGLVVRAVFLSLLRHQADIRHRSDRRRIERSVGAAIVDHGLVDAGVAGIRDDRFRVTGRA